MSRAQSGRLEPADDLLRILGRRYHADMTRQNGHDSPGAGREVDYSGLPWHCPQTGMPEPSEAVVGRHEPQYLAHCVIEPGLRPRLGSTETLLDLGVHLLDRR